MAFERRISKCAVCNNDYLQRGESYTLCKKAECKKEARRIRAIINASKRMKKHVEVDNYNHEVRFKNKFILGSFNACNAG